MAAPESKELDEGFEWPTTGEDYERKSVIGKGAYAEVWRASCKKAGREVAIKVIKLEMIAGEFDMRAEVATMMSSKHIHIMPLHACFGVGDELWLVMPLMNKGSAHYAMNQLRNKGIIKKGQGLKESWVAAILKAVVEALVYLHKNDKIHRDVKAGNILLDSDGRVRLGDFGVAGWTNHTVTDEAGKTTFVGTPCWMAPEVMEHKSVYSYSADVWSVGITALELCKGFAPYANEQPVQILLKTLHRKPPSLANYLDKKGYGGVPLSDNFVKFVKQCLQKDPKDRPTAAALLKLKFLDKAPSLEVVKAELLSDEMIPPLGSIKVDPTPAPGYGAAKVVFDTTKDYVPGTTWNFGTDDADSDPKDTVVERGEADDSTGDVGGGGGGDGDDEFDKEFAVLGGGERGGADSGSDSDSDDEPDMVKVTGADEPELAGSDEEGF